jgi:type I restriction enzyme R subunit
LDSRRKRPCLGLINRGLAYQLKQALPNYTESGGRSPSYDTAKAIAVMLEKHEVACAITYGFDWSKVVQWNAAEKMSLLPERTNTFLNRRKARSASSK